MPRIASSLMQEITRLQEIAWTFNLAVCMAKAVDEHRIRCLLAPGTSMAAAHLGASASIPFVIFH